MKQSVPRLLSLIAGVVGLTLFVYTLYRIDLDEVAASARRLGLALPLILLPGTLWHFLRTWGWAVAFPAESRPAFTRLFRVRLAADALSYFTVRGVVGEPLKPVLLWNRTPPQVTTAAVALERLAFAVVGIIVAGLFSAFAVNRLSMPWPLSSGTVATTWDALSPGSSGLRRSRWRDRRSCISSWKSKTSCWQCCEAIAGDW